MPSFGLKQKIIAIAVITGTVLVLILLRGSSKTETASTPSKQIPEATTTSQNEPPKIVSTQPDPLEEAIVTATEVVEITFNRPLENVGEFKVRIEPETDFKVELSGDRKTAKIIPAKPYELGTTYTLFIGPDSKFDGAGEWGQDKIFHFRTIKYRGV